MTDRGKLKKLLDDFGVSFAEKENDILVSSNSDKVDGYNGFYTAWLFDEAGKFIEMGIWE